MKAIGFNRPLYILPFDHRGSFETKMSGWHGDLSAAQTPEIAATKRVIYDGFKAAIAAGVPKEKAGILVDEQFGAAILRDAAASGYATACSAEKSGQGRGENDQKVLDWLTIAAHVKGFIGFAVGRTVFWEPLVGFRAKTLTREAAVAEIARRYQEFVGIFEKARPA